jgi:hypothetical protein
MEGFDEDIKSILLRNKLSVLERKTKLRPKGMKVLTR